MILLKRNPMPCRARTITGEEMLKAKLENPWCSNLGKSFSPRNLLTWAHLNPHTPPSSLLPVQTFPRYFFITPLQIMKVGGTIQLKEIMLLLGGRGPVLLTEIIGSHVDNVSDKRIICVQNVCWWPFCSVGRSFVVRFDIIGGNEQIWMKTLKQMIFWIIQIVCILPNYVVLSKKQGLFIRARWDLS